MSTHRELCHRVSAWLLNRADIHLTIWELKRTRQVVDVIGLNTKTKKVICVEVKAQRSDLLTELNNQKYLKYEQESTHCYFACDESIFKSYKKEDILPLFEERGVPAYWGILLVCKHEIRIIRPARAHDQSTVNAATINKLVLKIARAYAYRHPANKFNSH